MTTFEGIAHSTEELITSVKAGRFTLDGTNLKVGNFSCGIRPGLRDLKSLKGCPSIVNGHFVCYYNILTSLEGMPKEVWGSVNIRQNQITSLQNIHKIVRHINGGLFLELNPIKSHVLGLLKVEGLTGIGMDNAKVSKIINKYLPLGDILDCAEELVEAGFSEFAQL